jgi:hypothetical protein
MRIMPTTVNGTNGAGDDAGLVQDAIKVEGSVGGGGEGEVILAGTLDFKASGKAEVKDITNGITITGNPGTTIKGGDNPLRVNAPSLHVTIRGLRFVNPKGNAIRVEAVRNLLITRCRIEKVTSATVPGLPSDVTTAAGISISTASSTGDISIIDNEEIDIGGGAANRTIGIAVFGAGSAGQPVNLRIARNTVRNTTAHGIDLREIVGQATVEANTIEPGPVGSQPQSLGPDPSRGRLSNRFVNGIRCLGSGTYKVVGNRIFCEYANSAGIRLQGNSATAPITGAFVGNNTIVMLPSGGSAVGHDENAGIELRRNCNRNMVAKNTISGSGRAVIALVAESGTQSNNQLYHNSHEEFGSGLADIVISESVNGTVIDGGPRTYQGTIIDKGTGTINRGSYLPPPPPRGETPETM